MQSTQYRPLAGRTTSSRIIQKKREDLPLVVQSLSRGRKAILHLFIHLLVYMFFQPLFQNHSMIAFLTFRTIQKGHVVILQLLHTQIFKLL